MKTDNTNTPAGIISETEKATASHCVDWALRNGANGVRVTFGKNTLDTIGFLDGEIDKVSRCADRSVYITLFVEGRYGSYSTNRLEHTELENFILKAIDRTRMLAPDPCRSLPEPDRCARNACTGRELKLCDDRYFGLSAEEKLQMTTEGVKFNSIGKASGYKVISEECWYSDTIDDSFMVDSQGFEGRHIETSFNFCSEITIQNQQGHRLSGYYWSSSPFLEHLDIRNCSNTALQRAVAQLHPKSVPGGKYRMVVENISAPRLVAPLLSALNASAIQQKNSFLAGSLGQKIFSDRLNIMNFALSPGQTGSRLFDSEGVATGQRSIISEGKVGMFFVNTYMSKKMNIAPTVDGSSRPKVMPFISDSATGGIDLGRILRYCGDGILVTGFNGGNCNPTTGDFSYGIEGFVFRDGKILHPIREMLITGNMITLWNSVIAAGDDPREGTAYQIPTLAFENVDFAG